MMKFIFIVTSLLALSSCFTEENGVIILTDSDFKQAVTEIPYLMVEFYAPWCTHCKHLAPIYDQIAGQLQKMGNPIRVAKIDSDAHTQPKTAHGVQGYPTLLYFMFGKPLKYNGKRQKMEMLNWMLKKTRPSVTQLQSVGSIQRLKGIDKVSLVYYGDLTSQAGKLVYSLASVDDFNDYYFIKQDGSQHLEMYRPFGDTITLQNIDYKLKAWILANQRPLVPEFDDRIADDIFTNRKPAIIFFNSLNSHTQTKEFYNAAQQWKNKFNKKVIFTHFSATNQDWTKISEYLKLDPNQFPLIYIDKLKSAKYVLRRLTKEMTIDTVLTFLKNIENNKVKKYKIDEEVPIIRKPVNNVEKQQPNTVQKQQSNNNQNKQQLNTDPAQAQL